MVVEPNPLASLSYVPLQWYPLKGLENQNLQQQQEQRKKKQLSPQHLKQYTHALHTLVPSLSLLTHDPKEKRASVILFCLCIAYKMHGGVRLVNSNPYSYSEFEEQARLFAWPCDIWFKIIQHAVFRHHFCCCSSLNVHACKRETFFPTPSSLYACFQFRAATSALLAIISVSLLLQRRLSSSALSVSYYWYRSSAKLAPAEQNSASIWAIATLNITPFSSVIINTHFIFIYFLSSHTHPR